ncbi:unnamed protein product [Mycena citricolor]|uniref:Uncharacterized protein n=1 Tax=Mycena citricolor TaxID=2018698 RepID=A0AAD2HHC5_9AGAR|nr:unnamed protein product [Mycena citricolor]
MMTAKNFGSHNVLEVSAAETRRWELSLRRPRVVSQEFDPVRGPRIRYFVLFELTTEEHGRVCML